MIHQKALYLCLMPKDENEDLLLFVVPKAHWVATLNRCHRDAGQQGHDYLFPTAGMLLVARNDQSDATIHQKVCALLTT